MTGDVPNGGLKRLQRESPETAAKAYAERYREALDEGDQFLGPLYLDELLTSILLTSVRDSKPHEMHPDRLRSVARKHIGQVSAGSEHVIEDDLNVAILKRYPRELRKYEDLEFE
jgi:hypothetical protein